MTVTFTAELESPSGTTTGFRVPESVLEELEGGKRPKVVVQVNGFEYRSSIAPMGGEYWLGVSAARREEAGVAAGQVLEVSVSLDTEPREVEMPDDLSEALAADSQAQAFWASLSYSNQRYHVEQIAGAKKAETRAGRVAKTVAAMSQGRVR